MSNQQHHANEEESTIFRSIPMGSASGISQLPPLQKLSLGPPPAGAFSLPSKPAAFPKTAPVAKVPALNWNVDPATIPCVPGYPLERTHMACPASLSVEQITERIARVVEAHNLECAYHNDDDDESSTEDEEILPGRLDCASSNGDLKFVVQLWRNHTNEIVVEMQRRRGSSLEFSAIRKPLFQTLQSGELTLKKKSFAPPAFVPNKKLRVLPPSMMHLRA